MVKEGNNISDLKVVHDESQWTKTLSISTDITEECVIITKKEGISKKEIYYPTNIRLDGRF